MNDLQIRDWILSLRNQKLMLVRDLAELSGVTKKRLNEKVKLNQRRFSNNLFLQFTDKENWNWSEIVTV